MSSVIRIHILSEEKIFHTKIRQLERRFEFYDNYGNNSVEVLISYVIIFLIKSISILNTSTQGDKSFLQ